MKAKVISVITILGLSFSLWMWAYYQMSSLFTDDPNIIGRVGLMIIIDLSLMGIIFMAYHAIKWVLK